MGLPRVPTLAILKPAYSSQIQCTRITDIHLAMRESGDCNNRPLIGPTSSRGSSLASVLRRDAPMKSFNRIALGLACIAFAAVVIAPHVALRMHAATSTTPLTQPTYQYQTVVAVPCGQNGNGAYPTDLCVGPNYVPVETVLNSYSSQGYQLLPTTTSLECLNPSGVRPTAL